MTDSRDRPPNPGFEPLTFTVGGSERGREGVVSLRILAEESEFDAVLTEISWLDALKIGYALCAHAMIEAQRTGMPNEDLAQVISSVEEECFRNVM